MCACKEYKASIHEEFCPFCMTTEKHTDSHKFTIKNGIKKQLLKHKSNCPRFNKCMSCHREAKIWAFCEVCHLDDE